MRIVQFWLLALGVALAASSAAAAPLDPTAFTSLGTLNLAAGTYTVNTDAMTLTGPGTNFTGVASGNTCVFTFADITIQAGAVVNCTGTRTVAFLSQGTATISGTINGNGEDAPAGFISTMPLGGPGGGNGGNGTTPWTAGSGPGGGSPSVGTSGSGGGGFANPGANGGDTVAPGGQAGGAAYGDLATQLEGGSGGGGGEMTGGGGGGGGIEVTAVGDVTINAGGLISADGGNGAVANQGASGGGSGGGVIVSSSGLLTLAGTISVVGGDGGIGGC